eukprot:NODE_130_length_18488_cov_0.389961.p13 type:complete len:117 gc:universal NODE_130_length_18488_cov_0.389961:12977-12627(-)
MMYFTVYNAQIYPLMYIIMHINLLLNPIIAHNCQVCDKPFKTRESLYKHLRGVHTAKDPCPYCQRVLKFRTRPDNFRKHLLKCQPFLDQISSNSQDDFKIAVDHTIRHILTAIRSK